MRLFEKYGEVERIDMKTGERRGESDQDFECSDPCTSHGILQMRSTVHESSRERLASGILDIVAPTTGMVHPCVPA